MLRKWFDRVGWKRAAWISALTIGLCILPVFSDGFTGTNRHGTNRPTDSKFSPIVIALSLLGIPLGVMLMCAGVQPKTGLRMRGNEACSCGYSREGLGDAVCPECGREHEWPGGAKL